MLRKTVVLAILLSAFPHFVSAQEEPLGETVSLGDFERIQLFLKRDSKIPDSRSGRMPALMYAWYMIQDSTLQLIWNKPGGVKEGGDSFLRGDESSFFDGDIDLLALSSIRAFEIHALIFDIWREPLRTLELTRITGFSGGQHRSFNPRWYDAYNDLLSYATSLIWVHRVMLTDGTILMADEDAVLEAASLIGSDVSAEDLLPERVRVPQLIEGK